MKERGWIKDPLLWVTLILVTFYLAFAAARPVGTFWSLDEGGKFLHLQNMIRTGSISGPLLYPGAEIDGELRFVPLLYYARGDSQIYSWWPVGFSVVTLPVYRLLGWMGLYIVPAFAGGLSALCAGLLVRQSIPQPECLSVFAALITGLATPIAFYSSMFWEHTLATACLLLAVIAITRAWTKQQIGLIVVAGILSSVGSFFRTEIVGLAAGLGLVLLLRRWRWGFIYGGIFFVASIPWLIFNDQMMGHFISRQWVPGANSLNSPMFTGIQQSGKWFLPHLLLNAPRIAAFEFAPMTLIVGTLLVVSAIITPFITRLRPVAYLAYLGIVAISGATVLSQAGYRSVHGLVLIAPQIVFVPWLYTRSHRRSDSVFPDLLLGVIVVFGGVFASRAWTAAGGQQWGPRYLLTLYPLLVAAAVIGIHQAWPQLKQRYQVVLLALFILCTLIGLGFEVRGAHASLRTTTYYAETSKALRTLGQTLIITDCTWLPMVIPELYWQGNVFSVRGTDQLAAWRGDAAAIGVSSAYSVTLDMCTLRLLDEIAPGRTVDPDGLTLTLMQIESGAKQ